MARLQTHHIDVQTLEENVTVTIGGDGGIPGGFAKLFNRVIDSGLWARLPDAARAAYLPLVRCADHRDQFRVRMGLASIMKYSGLSRSSAKRAIKDLLTSRLVVLVEQGGVSELGQNESNCYQLMVPAESRMQPRVNPTSHPLAVPATSATPHRPVANPASVQRRTPSRFSAEPPVAPAADRVAVPARHAGPVQPRGQGRSAGGPQLRTTLKPLQDSASHRLADLLQEPLDVIDPPPTREDVAALLESKGVDGSASRQLAAAYPLERILDVIAAMEYRQARGGCANPGGYIREALLKRWAIPQAVTRQLQVKADEQARLQRQQREQSQRRQESATAQSAAALDEQQIENRIAALDDCDLAILADAVLEKYQNNPTVLKVLTGKPPRQCRLMKMEIARILER